MNREFILFIAYNACYGKDIFGKNPFQYRNAFHLIGINIWLHIIELILVFAKKDILKNGQLTSVHYLILLGGGIIILFVADLLFPKRVLAKALVKYKEAPIKKWSKLIAFGYLILNLVIVAFLASNVY